MLEAESGPDPEAIKEVLDHANEARAQWVAGTVASSRQYNPHRELPSFAEGMGEMFLGRKAIEARKAITQRWSGQDKKR
jgi:hypothetical protein